jgi:hypothetical protein
VLEPSDDGRRMLREWLPPMAFPPVVIHYWDPQRPPDLLWLMRYDKDERGRPAFLAVGPAGQPVARHLIREVVTGDIPYGAQVHLCTTVNAEGRQVFGRPSHTHN